MADLEFLASFGVDIDENGVSRLQQILTENRTLAESLSKSFEAASESVKAFKAQVTTDLPSLFSGNGYGNVTENLFGSLGGLKIGLNMTEPKKEIASFTADAKKPIDLTANANAIVCIDGRVGSGFFGNRMAEGAFGQRGRVRAEHPDEPGDGTSGGGTLTH